MAILGREKRKLWFLEKPPQSCQFGIISALLNELPNKKKKKKKKK